MDQRGRGRGGFATGESSWKLVLGGDVGGTNTSLALAWVAGRQVRLTASFRYPTPSLQDLAAPLREVLAYARERLGRSVESAVLGVAGPVSGTGRRVKLTNADLWIDPPSLKRRLGLRHLSLLNDFVALGYGINCLRSSDLLEFPPSGRRDRAFRLAPRAAMGAGTGLGKCLLIYHPELGLHVPYPSEGGHADFPATSPWERELVSFLEQMGLVSGRISYEDLLSGAGLGRIYRFLRHRHPIPETPLLRRIDQAEDKAPLISEHLDVEPLCREAFARFLELYANCARNFALETLPWGGIYLAGGIVARNLAHIDGQIFRKRFEDHPRHRSLLESIPIRIVRRYEASLYGAALAASLADSRERS